jgi:phosphoribosylanthranilate isomerase
MTKRTRIKICGITRVEDLQAAVNAGADAVGFVFYEKSPRYIAPSDAAALIAALPPFITPVGLFVNAGPQQVAEVVAEAPISLLQFHGDETPEQCVASAVAANRGFMRAVRVDSSMGSADLLKCELNYRAAGRFFSSLLLDAFVEGYGGGGRTFDWSLIPEELAPRVVLSGGLNTHNVADAVARIRPYAVDVSSGVESAKGIKDAGKIEAFVEAVRSADMTGV